MSQQPKHERRKEQNRKAQANHRKRKQERLRFLEQQLIQSADSRSLESSINSPIITPAGHSIINKPQTLDSSQLNANISPAFTGDEDYSFSFAGALPTYPNAHVFTDIQQHPGRLISEDIQELQLSLEDGGTLSNRDNSTLSRDSGERRRAEEAQQRCPRAQKQTCAFDALAFNARRLQYSKEYLVGSHGVSIFFSPLCSIKSSDFPLDLQPTWAQMTYQHHPYIDCIPWPDLRSRIILAQAHRPPLIDSFSIWHAILLGGISCDSDPADLSHWQLNANFEKKYKALLSYDLPTLQARTLGTNPPLRLVIPTTQHS